MTHIYHQQDEEEGFDIVEKDGKSYNIGEMLHGCCDLFALELGQKLREKKYLIPVWNNGKRRGTSSCFFVY